MKKSYECLLAGITEHCCRIFGERGTLHAFQLKIIAGLVGELIEGSTLQKKDARTTLHAIIGRGRCILNAHDFEAGLKKGAKQNDA